LENNSLNLKAMIGTLDGRNIIRTEITGSPENAEQLENFREKLLNQAAEEILDELH
jgi:porphobilinogen deaminase